MQCSILWHLRIKTHVVLNLLSIARSENGYKVASYDRDLDGRTMNFNSAPGFALLGCQTTPWTYFESCIPQKPNLALLDPRLAIWIAMNMTTNALGMLGPDCGSWGLPARGSSQRSEINIWGNLFSSWVRGGTQMISRSFVCIQVFFLTIFFPTNDWQLPWVIDSWHIFGNQGWSL